VGLRRQLFPSFMLSLSFPNIILCFTVYSAQAHEISQYKSYFPNKARPQSLPYNVLFIPSKHTRNLCNSHLPKITTPPRKILSKKYTASNSPAASNFSYLSSTDVSLLHPILRWQQIEHLTKILQDFHIQLPRAPSSW
jgi:hypothetical protein